MKSGYLILLSFMISGCGIHATITDITVGTTGFAAEVRKTPKTYQSGNAQGADSEYENPFEKQTTYKQIQQERLPASR